MSDNLARRSIISIIWKLPASLVATVVLFTRGIILMRLLPVEVFGIYSFASGIIIISSMTTEFGIGAAFVHRSAETENEADAAATYFTLKLCLTFLWYISAVLLTITFANADTQTALLLASSIAAVGSFNATPQRILVRRVVHRKLAVIQTVSAILSTIVGLFLAFNGFELVTLYAIDFTITLVNLFFLYVYRPVWRPRLRWHMPTIRYYFRFGSRSVTASILNRAIDRVDDLWVFTYLGETAAGIYARAYTLAAYQRRILAASVNAVSIGTYAELKGERALLSRAFFSANALLVRSGFFIAGVLNLLAPELILLLFTDKWQAMLEPFRLMLLFATLDPIRATLANLFNAVGHPEQVAYARVIQLIVLGVGLFVLGGSFGVNGAAVAINLTLFVGAFILLSQARRYVDFSLRRLLAMPTLGCAVALITTFIVLTIANVDNPWISGGIKIGLFTTIYGGCLLITEGDYIRSTITMLYQQLASRRDEQFNSIKQSAQ